MVTKSMPVWDYGHCGQEEAEIFKMEETFHTFFTCSLQQSDFATSSYS